MKVLVLANFGMGLYKFRKELLQEMIDLGYEVTISLPYDEYVPLLEDMGCKYINSKVNRRGTSPKEDIELLLTYIKLMNKVKPDIVLTYTIKPNIYGGIASRITKNPYLANVTGLGTALENKGPIQKITLKLYKIALKKAKCVFFQNESNKNVFLERDIVNGEIKLLPGSGVNLQQHQFESYPNDNGIIKFVYVGRIMNDKGINELLEAAEIIKNSYPNVEFHIVGFCEENYDGRLNELEKKGVIKYHGQQNDVHKFIKNAHATILPSYHEGLSNVLLETAATGRPILASNIPGCKETFDEGVSGLGFEVKNVKSLKSSIISFIELPYESKKNMGFAGRQKMTREYDRKIVIDTYLKIINR